MRLVRFLTAGKSLVGLKDTEGRYQLPNGRALPRFGAVKDVGVSAGAETARQQIQAEPEATTASTDAGVCAVQRRVEVDAGLGKRPQSQSESAPRLRSDRSESRSIFRKLFGWLPWFRQVPAVGGIPAFSRIPVQTELSLENVKVIRNDLSESDLEFQSAGNQPALNPFSKPQVGEPVEAVATPPNLPGAGVVPGGN